MMACVVVVIVVAGYAAATPAANATTAFNHNVDFVITTID
jgi:hypothetical protein